MAAGRAAVAEAVAADAGFPAAKYSAALPLPPRWKRVRTREKGEEEEEEMVKKGVEGTEDDGAGGWAAGGREYRFQDGGCSEEGGSRHRQQN